MSSPETNIGDDQEEPPTVPMPDRISARPKRSPIPPHKKLAPKGKEVLMQHIDAIKNLITIYNAKREVLSLHEIAYLAQYYQELIAERNARADEVESPEIKEAVEIMNKNFHSPIFAQLCVDGRVNLTLMFGFTGGGMKGGSLQTPAGDSNAFILMADGSLALDPESELAIQVDQTASVHKERYELLDSHLACAARGIWEKALGHSLTDKGLRADVIRKKKMAQALRKYLEQKHPDSILTPMHFSFDVHNGYGYMGLEQDELLAAAEERGYEDGGHNGHDGHKKLSVLERLAHEGKIISTELLAKDSIIHPIFEQYFMQITRDIEFDWRIWYKEIGRGFWKAIEDMRPRILPIISEKLKPLYPDAKKEEMEDRAMLILCNVFNGFCNNYGREKYPYAEHEETFISVTTRDYRPCEKAGFGVDSHALEFISQRVNFASQIVRDVRGRQISEGQTPPEGFESQEWVSASVPVVVKEIFRKKLDNATWDSLRKIDWSFLHGVNWKKLDDGEFISLIYSNNPDLRLDADVAMAFNTLRRRMAALYDRKGESDELLMDGRLFAVPVIADRSRRFQVIIPFHINGFDFLVNGDKN